MMNLNELRAIPADRIHSSGMDAVSSAINAGLPQRKPIPMWTWAVLGLAAVGYSAMTGVLNFHQLEGWFFIIAALGWYFLPFSIGMKRPDRAALFALNLLLGWTLIGWVAALVWALLPVRK